MNYAVIMAGGAGTRLWPLSRKGQPKQALRLIGERTMFQHAVDRLEPLFPMERILVVTSAAIADVLRPQVPALPAENFILEPVGRDSAPAAGLAAIRLLAKDPDAIMAMVTADHFIVDAEQFRAVLAAAAEVAAEGTIVTLGIRPTYPATGYGYVAAGGAHTIVDGFRVYRSAGFTEKPDRTTAIRFVEDGRYSWNSGMFIWRADRLMAEYRSQLPDLHASLSRIAAAFGAPDGADVLRSEWEGIRRISIDYGIMEHAQDVVVIPAELGWSDIGSWASLLDILEGDEAGNVLQAPVVALDTRRTLIRSESGPDRLIAAVGLEDMIIVDTPNVLLVCPRSRAEQVRDIVKRLESAGALNYL
jgi:mannose-1-phosphate guanylyltransferase